MATRTVYLKIERVADYSPVCPQEKTPPNVTYKRDGMLNHGHDDGTIPDAEVQARSLEALVYREYRDPQYLIPVTTKLVAADLNEPIWDRRVPGALIWAYVGEDLAIHVLNGDIEPHSLHVHGLAYGIDSDGSWPLGTQSTDGRRSDAICPGQTWTYHFHITKEMVGAWPFHDHAHHADAAIKRGLFGAIIVREKKFKVEIPRPLPDRFIEPLLDELKRHTKRPMRADALPKPARTILHQRYEWLREWSIREMRCPPFREGRLHVPVFFHQMVPDRQAAIFDEELAEEVGANTVTIPFNAAGMHDYFCRFHPEMEGTVEVVAGGPATAAVNILDAPARGFYPPTIQIGVGGSVTWTNLTNQHHTVTAKEGSSMPTHCINGRGFVGNSPTVLARAGQDIRWYVFNLDLGAEWHNFHLHAMRWQFAGATIDVRSISPAESFTVDTKAPPVILLPKDIEDAQHPPHRPPGAHKYTLMGDFVFHCHVHHHMMNGMVGVVRSVQDVWLTDAMKTRLEAERGLILYDESNPIPHVNQRRCREHGEGRVEELPRPADVVTFMHATLLANTTKLLYWGYSRADQSRLWESVGDTIELPANQPAGLPGMTVDLSDLWSAAHAYRPDGTILAHGGFAGPGGNEVNAFLFDPATRTWSQTASTADPRFYATTLTLADGNCITLFGSGSKSIEQFTGATWPTRVVTPAAMDHHVFYPWTYLLPDGSLFIAGPHGPSQRLTWNPPTVTATYVNRIADRSSGGEKGTSVLLPLRPPSYAPQVIVLGGNTAGAADSVEFIDLSAATPAWRDLPNLQVARPEQVNSVLLPDGRVLVVGGAMGAGDGGQIEFLDSRDIDAQSALGPAINHFRGYHSAAILLVDGSVLIGGDPNPSVFERYYPGYCFQPRPTISAAPAAIAYGAGFHVATPEASVVVEAVLMKPGAVTHGFNMSQRAIECAIVGGDAAGIDVVAPPNGNVAPPGYYLLFLVDANRVPSTGRWIRLG